MQQAKFFPQGCLKDLYQTLVEEKAVLSLHSSNNLQHKNNIFSSLTNYGVFRHQQLASLHNKTKLVTSVFVIFHVEELKGNSMQITRKLPMAKTLTRIMGFT
jgi:hypothetical protein